MVNPNKKVMTRAMHADRVDARHDISCCIALNVMAATASANPHHRWRQQLTIADARRYCRTPGLQGPTVGVLSSGGCLDTLAALRCGFRPLWGTEVDERLRALWSHLTHTPDLGDTFNIDWHNQAVPDMLISGQPCTNYSSSGNQLGDEGETGHMFVAQAGPILTLEPSSFVLEMVANAQYVHKGRELDTLVSRLQHMYVVKTKAIRTIDHGDGTNRTRLFIVGLHRRLGKIAYTFKFPRGNGLPPPTARSYAIPDKDVSPQYWRETPILHTYPVKQPRQGQLHKVAQIAPGMGHSSYPHAIYSWDGIFNCQTTYNGGGMRPPIDWVPGQRIERCRLTTPIECVRLASLPDDYLDLVRTIDDDDTFVFKSVNMGVPLRTATDIYGEVARILNLHNAITGERAGSLSTPTPPVSQCNHVHIENHRCCYASEVLSTSLDGFPYLDSMRQMVRSMLVDSGCDHTLGFTDLKPYLGNRRKANVGIQVASGQVTPAQTLGTLQAYAVDTANPADSTHTKFSDEVLTVPTLNKELFSIDSFYRDKGYDVHLRQPPGWSGMEKGDHKIPFRYNWTDAGWYMDYIPIPPDHQRLCTDSKVRAHKAYSTLLKAEFTDRKVALSKSNAAEARANCYSSTVAKCIHERIDKDPLVQETIVCTEIPDDDPKGCMPRGTAAPEGSCNKIDDAPTGVHCIDHLTESFIARHPDDRELRGVREGLKVKKRKISLPNFHKDHGHIGECPDCDICDKVKGVMRRITKRADVIRDRRVGYAWSMDMITLSDRSLEKHKYLIVLRDRSYSRVVKLIPLQFKSDAYKEVRKWIISLREDPIHSKNGYEMVDTIVTDHDGAWDHDTATWQQHICAPKAEGGLNVKTLYISKDRHAQNPAERNVGIVECVIKAILMQQNLPPSWWTRAACDAEFLLNRFPPISTDAAVPLDHDIMRPIEIFTHGFYSRAQCNREINYYVPVGTPCLVHDTRVRGSTLAPKVRWGIACGMQRETPYFICPFISSTFHGKSYTAYKLRSGLNYAQFLGLSSLQSTQRSLVLPSDLELDERVVVQLPPMAEAPKRDSLPIRLYSPPTEESDAALDEVLEAKLSAPEDKGSPHEEGGIHSNRRSGVAPKSDTAEAKCGTGPPCIPNADVLGGDTDLGLNEHQASPDGTSPKGTPNTCSDKHKASPEVLVSNALNYNAPPSSLAKSEAEAVERIRMTLHGSRPAAGSPAHEGQRMTDSNRESEVEAPKEEDLRPYDDSMFCSIELMDESLWDKAEEDMCRHEAVTSGQCESFHKLIRRFKPPILYEHMGLYRQWLLTSSPTASEWSEDMIPLGRGQYLEEGLVFPKPTGHNWRCMLEQHELDQGAGGDPTPDVRRALHTTLRWVRSHKNKPINAHKTKRTKAIESGMKECPKTLERAWRGDDALEWVKAADLEMDTLTEMGVFDHGYSKQQLIDLGICDFVTKKPINLSVCLDHKYTDGVLTRYKVRMAVAGHKYNLKKGVHYDEVFAPAPNQNTARLLAAMTVAMGLKRKSWDIKLAYCWADMPKDQLLALQYPKGYERYEENGLGEPKPLYIVLRKNCYGVPNAGRIWSHHRDSWMMEHFNRDGWTCHKCTYDPTLFYITRNRITIDPKDVTKTRRPAKEEAWISIHTDDCDGFGTSDAILNDIYNAMNRQWKAKEVDSNFMLGVKRRFKIVPGGNECELTMTAYIVGMCEAFKDHIPDTNPSTPFPANKYLWRSKEADPAETQEMLNLGYQRAIGMLLWAQRGVYPECAYGLNQLCRLMSAPTREAWAAAMHMMAYMRCNKEKGIKFHSKGNEEPIIFSDAAFNPDPADGLSQYGYCAMWMGGPIASVSKKLAHVGLSSFHNEYMAIRHAAAEAMWIRQLLTEIGCECFVRSPTQIFGDNDAANNLCAEDFISTGNKYIYTPYHWVKELDKHKYIKVLRKPTKENLSDLYTKPCVREVCAVLIDRLKGYMGWS